MAMAGDGKNAYSASMRQLYEQIVEYIDSLMSVIGGGVAIHDRSWRVVYYSTTYARWFGPLEQNEGKPCYEVICKRLAPSESCPLPSLFTNPEQPPPCLELEVPISPAEKRLFRFIFFPAISLDGTVDYVIEVAEDITEKRRTAQELTECAHLIVTLNRVAGIMFTSLSTEEALPDILSLLVDEMDLERAWLYVLDAANRHYALAAQKCVPGVCAPAPEIVPADDALARMAAPRRKCRTISEKDFAGKESVMRPRPGARGKVATLVPLESAKQSLGFLLLFSGEEQARCFKGFCLILRAYLSSAVEKGLLFSKLQESEKRYRELFEASPDCIAVIGPDLRVLDANSVCERGGRSVEEMTGQDVLAFLSPRYHDIVPRLVDRALAGERVVAELETIHKDGTTHPIEVSMSRFHHMGRAAVALISRDMAERKEAEREMRKMAKLTQTVTDAIVAVDKAFKITAWNPGAERIFGYSAEEALGRHISLIHIISEDVREVTRAMLEKGEFVGECLCRGKNGEPMNIVLSVSRLEDESGRIEGCVGFAKNVTELRQIQQQLFQAQKMESIGALAGGIAHDFNNILSGILGHASFLKGAVSPESDFYYDVERIESSAKSAAALTRELLGFARGGKFEPQPTGLNEIVGEALELLSPTIGKNIALHSSLQEGLWAVDADRTQMQQVLMNLCINSRNAMPEGGRLLLETRNVRLYKKDLKPAYAPAKPGKYVRVSVSDTGVGMDKETVARVFEPAFSRKKGGTGLGLPVAYGIVRGHSGFITVYSEPGEGATFRVYLPASKRPAEKETREPEPGIAAGHETILIIDDEPAVRDVLARMLGKMGYNVLVAGSGDEGLAEYSARKGQIDLVLLDMIIPDMPGHEIFARLREMNPDVRVLLSSGFSETEAAAEARRHGALGFIEKPYTMGELSAEIRRALGKTKKARGKRQKAR